MANYGRFDDLRFDTIGRSLSDSTSNGIARRLRGNAGIYVILDETLSREGEKEDEDGSAFVRTSFSPTRSSMVDCYIDARLAYRGLFDGRDSDTVDFFLTYECIRAGACRANHTADILIAVRKFKTVFEATHQALVVPGFTVRLDFQ